MLTEKDHLTRDQKKRAKDLVKDDMFLKDLEKVSAANLKEKNRRNFEDEFSGKHQIPRKCLEF